MSLLEKHLRRDKLSEVLRKDRASAATPATRHDIQDVLLVVDSFPFSFPVSPSVEQVWTGPIGRRITHRSYRRIVIKPILHAVQSSQCQTVSE